MNYEGAPGQELESDDAVEAKDPMPAEPDGERGGEDSELSSLVERVVRRVLPDLMAPGHGDGRQEAATTDSEDLREIKTQLASARQEIALIRAEKAARDRELYLKDQIRALGVRNIELAYKAVREEIEQSEDGEWIARVGSERVPATQFLRSFVSQNPELVPARLISGSGTPARSEEFRDDCDLDQIRPGMDPVSLRRAREAVVRIIAQSKRTL